MATYRELCKRAKKMGHKLTPELRGELKILAAIPDEEIQAALRKQVVKDMARNFQVPVSAMEQCIGKLKPKDAP